MRTRWAALLGFGLLLAACGRSPATPAPPPAPIIRPIQVDSVQVLVDGSVVSAHVKGVIGDGCTELAGVMIQRGLSGDTSVSIQILSQRPAEATCTQIARMYDQTLRIPGDFPPGHYALRVNSVATTFDVP